jgi:hypothetical protein
MKQIPQPTKVRDDALLAQHQIPKSTPLLPEMVTILYGFLSEISFLRS